MGKKNIFVLVSSDLVTDNRVLKTTEEIYNLGYNVLLIGRKKNDSIEMPKLTFQTKRIRTFVEKGPFFYFILNIRLFLILLFRKVDGIFSNDLDTLLPAYLISKVKRVPLVYDSHELFTEVPELIHRPKVKAIWSFIEKRIFPKLKYTITVNNSIADVFNEKYSNRPIIVRNVPKKYRLQEASRSSLGLPIDKFIAIIQGSGLNIGRGLIEAIEAIEPLDQILLLVVGNGDAIPQAKILVQKLNINEKIIFIPRLPYLEMMKYTEIADVGLSLDRPLGLNYEFSLPNKIFDYIHAHTPILCTDLKEVSQIVKTFNCGIVLSDINIPTLTEAFKSLSSNSKEFAKMKENCVFASKTEHWEEEKKALISLIQRAFA